MEIRYLQHFIALAEEGQFTAAARKVHIVQSGLSMSIKELEQELGVALVERTTRRVALTRAGEVFLEHARASLATLYEGVQAVRLQGSVVQGMLRIGILQSLRPYLDLPVILRSFNKLYPEVEFTISSPASDRMPDLVRSGALDLAFYPEHRTSSPAGLDVRPFRKDSLVVVSGRGTPFLSSSPIKLEDLARVPFVDLVPERALRKLIDRAFGEVAIHREIRYEVSEIESLIDFVDNGLGVAIIPSRLAKSAAGSRALKVCALKQTKRPFQVWNLVLLTRQNRKQVPIGAPLPLFLKALLKHQNPGARPAVIPAGY
jgi:DNA-binding transcriptional LysR family regulator